MSFVSFDNSLEDLKNSFSQDKTTEMVFISDAIDRVIADDIITSENSPQFPTSAMDGYAIKFEDQKNGRIKILGDLPAGSSTKEILQNTTCIKTFTGSLMCEGSDTLIPIEMVEVDGDEIVIKEAVKFGFSVRPVGENYKKDEVLIKRGTTIGFAEIGVMASLNISQIKVYVRPTIGILATGSEILDVGELQTDKGQIRSSNQFTLEALAKKEGAKTIRAGLTKDDKDSLKDAISSLLHSCDIVVTTGGVSVGDYDFVKDIIAEYEPEYITKGVVMKPGQHIKIVKLGHKYIFALPGFPYSSTVTFLLYVVPMIRAMQGKSFDIEYKEGILNQDYIKKSKKTEFATADLTYVDGEYRVDFSTKRDGSSAILTNMLGDVCLMRLEDDESDKEKGSKVKIIDLKDF
ncbi:MAG TPA: molybdopterin molybdenumtransferase MoeA [Campylobacterales bacterium]|nr:molybdopterin molybdenumtransferase MoeA [Campylobacterales bacterium]